MYQRLQRNGNDEGCRLLLIGKTGSGKSTTGNILFSDQVFESEMISSSVTRVCQTHTDAVNNRRVTVIDTPDFIYSTHTDFDSESELKRALCEPGAHVILLILPLSTFTEQEKHFIDWFQQKFGAEALRFTLVLLTHADKTHVTPLGEMIRENNELYEFINQCGQRYHEFNIKAPANREQVTELMEKIDRLVSENRNSRYTLEMMLENERMRRAYEEQERGRRSENPDKIAKWGKQLKLKYFCAVIFFAVATGGVSVWKEDSAHGWVFTKGSFTGGSAAAAGVFTGILWRLMLKNQFIQLSSPEHPSAVRQLLLKTAGVGCGLSAGAVIGHFLGGYELPVTVLAGLAGAAGALAPIRR